MATYFPMGGSTYTLQSSISSTQTTITLSSFKVPVSNDNITMALMNTSIAYGTIAPKTAQSEFISFTGITQNADGTATLTGVTRGLNKTHPGTEDTDFKLPHAGSSQFILSDAPQVFFKYDVIENDVTITGKKTFPGGGNANAPVSGTVYAAPTNDLEYASKKYVDNVAIAGAPDATTATKGIGRVSVAPVAPTIPIFVGDNDGRVPTQGENDALVGNNTDIAVGTGNKFVTQTGLQKSAEKYVLAASGSSTVYTATLSPVPTSYTNGMEVLVKIDVANTTTTPTINVNGLGAKTIVKGTSTALVANDMIVGQVARFVYDGTNMVLQNPSTSDTGFLTSGAPGTTTSNTTATVLTYALPGGILGTNKGVKIRITVQIAITGSNNGATYTVNYGSSAIAVFGYNGNSGTPTVTQILVNDLLIIGSGATNTQRTSLSTVMATVSGSGGASANQLAATNTSAIDSTASQNITISCTAGSSVTGTLVDYFIEKIV